MSGLAMGWAKKRDAPCKASKALLVYLADYADADGFAWPAVGRMATELQISERHVKRLLRALEGRRLLIAFQITDAKSGRCRTRAYWFPVEPGDAEDPAPTACALASFAENVGGRVTRVSPWEGDTGVTPEGDTDARGRVTPASPYSSTRTSKINHTPRAKPDADCREQAKALWMDRDKARVSPGLVDQAWAGAAAAIEGGAEKLLEAVRRYLANAGEVKRGHVLQLHRWLIERRYEAWLEQRTDLFASANGNILGHLPSDFVSAAKAAVGEDAASAWLGRAQWRGEDQTIVVGKTAFDWLNLHLRPVMAEHNIKIEARKAA